MRFSLGTLVLIVLASFAFAGHVPPMTAKDVSLMLRSGYSNDTVVRELTTRHFTGTLDAPAEANLVEAGASPALIAGLKSGAFAVPASEVAAVQAEQAAKEKRRAAQLEESHKLDTLYQARLKQTPKSPATTQSNNIAALVKGELVTSRNGILHPHLDGEFEKKKLIALYLSAYWCPPCRQFTPKLVAYYNKVVAAHPEFEVLFVSNDKTAGAMEKYMRDDQMPWPAVTYDRIASTAGLLNYFGPSIPGLVVVDENGKVIFDTYEGKNYRGPEAVLNDLDQFFAGKSPAQIAQAH